MFLPATEKSVSEIGSPLPAMNKSPSEIAKAAPNSERETEIGSKFRLIVVASLRSKQLYKGSPSRLEANPLRRRNTSIALEEVRRGLVHFTIRKPVDRSPAPNS